MKKFKDLKTEILKDEEVKKEYDILETKYMIVSNLIEMRKRKEITQIMLSELSGLRQAEISRIENGNANPSIKTLEKLAKGLDCKLQISFIPNEKAVG